MQGLAELRARFLLSQRDDPAWPDPSLTIFIVFPPNYTRRGTRARRNVLWARENPTPVMLVCACVRSGLERGGGGVPADK